MRTLSHHHMSCWQQITAMLISSRRRIKHVHDVPELTQTTRQIKAARTRSVVIIGPLAFSGTTVRSIYTKISRPKALNNAVQSTNSIVHNLHCLYYMSASVWWHCLPAVNDFDRTNFCTAHIKGVVGYFTAPDIAQHVCKNFTQK